MHFRAPVGRAGTVQFGVPEHAGERRDAEALDVGAREEPRFDFGRDDAFLPAVNAIGAGDARTIEQRIDIDGRSVALDEEFGEAREFLRARQCRVDGDAARRKPILLEFAG